MNTRLASKMLLAFSIVLMFLAMMMDTSVDTGYGRVNNIGLQHDQLIMILIGGVGFIAGIILFTSSQNLVNEEQNKIDFDMQVQRNQSR